MQCLESPKLAKFDVCYYIDNPCPQLDYALAFTIVTDGSCQVSSFKS